MKLILTQEVAGLGAPGDDRRGQGRLRPQLPGAAAASRSRGPRAPRSRSTAIKRARDARAIRDQGHATEVKAQVEALTRHGPGQGRRGRPAVRLGQRLRRRRRGQGRRRPAARQALGHHRVSHQDRSARTGCRWPCSPRSPRRSRSRSSRPDRRCSGRPAPHEGAGRPAVPPRFAVAGAVWPCHRKSGHRTAPLDRVRASPGSRARPAQPLTAPVTAQCPECARQPSSAPRTAMNHSSAHHSASSPPP